MANFDNKKTKFNFSDIASNFEINSSNKNNHLPETDSRPCIISSLNFTNNSSNINNNSTATDSQPCTSASLNNISTDLNNNYQESDFIESTQPV